MRHSDHAGPASRDPAPAAAARHAPLCAERAGGDLAGQRRARPPARRTQRHPPPAHQHLRTVGGVLGLSLFFPNFSKE